MRRTKEETEETRRAILQAAEELFLERGYDAVSLDDVAQAAGFTRGAVHWHFRNKLGLLMAIHEVITSPVQELAERLTSDGGLDPVEEWRTVTLNMLHRLDTDPRRRKLVRVMAGAMWLEGSEMARQKRHHFDNVLNKSVCNILRLVQERGRLVAPWKPEIASLAFHALIGGLVNQWLLDDDENPTIRKDALRAVDTFIISVARPA